MPRKASVLVITASICLGAATVGSRARTSTLGQAAFRVETRTARQHDLGRYTERELGILEKLNRADAEHLAGLREIVVPLAWAFDELAYAPLPARYPAANARAKLMVVHLPGQMFGAYESGHLVRWGPVSSGAKTTPTPSGLFHLNWRAVEHDSTVNPQWHMTWYFNFANVEGLAFHAYALPGYPASHACIRLLRRDAEWLYGWGSGWTLNPAATEVVAPGTPVLIAGAYDFNAPPPWRAAAWLAQTVELPPLP